MIDILAQRPIEKTGDTEKKPITFREAYEMLEKLDPQTRITLYQGLSSERVSARQALNKILERFSDLNYGNGYCREAAHETFRERVSFRREQIRHTLNIEVSEIMGILGKDVITGDIVNSMDVVYYEKRKVPLARLLSA